MLQSEPVKTGEIRVLDITPGLARSMLPAAADGFVPEFEAASMHQRIGAGDQLEITLWEAAPAMLFAALTEVAGSSRAMTLPAQTVGADGAVTVPFVGRLPVVGKEAKAVEQDIVRALAGRAHKPQALVRVVRAHTQEVTVVGEVAQATRMPLTPKGERLLDAIAAAGGSKAPVDKVVVQLSRDGKSRTLPLERVVREPAQNVRLQAGDVITVYHQPMSFTAMGAVQRQGEVPFEATGISLAQAITRAGGVVDARADAAGVFVFRQEEGPTVYRLNLRDPAAILAMRDFPVRDKDILYVSNAPLADFQKFMQVVASVVYPVASLRNLAAE